MADFLTRWARHPFTLLTAIVACGYGIGFAFGWWDGQPTLVWLGGVVCLVLLIASLAVAALRR